MLILCVGGIKAQKNYLSIIGTWKLEKYDYKQRDKNDILDPKKEFDGLVFSIEDDKHFTSYKQEGNNLIVIATGEYSISADKKYLYQNGSKMEIIRLTSQELDLKRDSFLIWHFIRLSNKKDLGTIIKGTAINKLTRAIIPYATIGLMHENKNVQADEDGKFILGANQNNDTLLITSVGYKDLKIALSSLPNDGLYLLEEKKITLHNLEIGRRYKNTAILNDFKDCSTTSFWAVQMPFNTGHCRNIAQHFHAPVENCLLSKINICKDYHKSLFRLRVYDMDTVLGGPGKSITDTFIEVKSRKKLVHINVEKYNIVIPQKDFFITAEWLCIPDNDSKQKAVIDGKEILDNKFYYPAINYRAAKAGKDTTEVWENSNGKWELNKSPKAEVLLISTKVKY